MKFKCHFHDGEGKLLKESKFLLKKQIMENQKKRGKPCRKLAMIIVETKIVAIHEMRIF